MPAPSDEVGTALKSAGVHVVRGASIIDTRGKAGLEQHRRVGFIVKGN